jgi:hypothetical protein
VKELKEGSKHVKRHELAKTLEKVRIEIKYEYIEELFRHITKKLEGLS